MENPIKADSNHGEYGETVIGNGKVAIIVKHEADDASRQYLRVMFKFRAAESARTEVPYPRIVPDTERGVHGGSSGHEGRRQTGAPGRSRLIFRP